MGSRNRRSLRYNTPMRVIGGTHGGRRLRAVDGTQVRPTSDRVREAVFNSLFSMGLPDGAHVVDAFAGTGALGIEALSRGAASVTFIDREAVACSIIEQNLADLDLADSATVLRTDAVTAIASQVHDIDLVLADAPYDFDEWDRFLTNCPAAVVVIESDRPIAPPKGSWWEPCRQKKYGKAVVTILTPTRST